MDKNIETFIVLPPGYDIELKSSFSESFRHFLLAELLGDRQMLSDRQYREGIEESKKLFGTIGNAENFFIEARELLVKYMYATVVER